MIDMYLMKVAFTMTWAMRPDRVTGGDYNGDGNLDWMDDQWCSYVSS